MYPETEQDGHHEPPERLKKIESELGYVVKDQARHGVGRELHYDIDDLRCYGEDPFHKTDERRRYRRWNKSDGNADDQRKEHHVDHVRACPRYRVEDVLRHDGLNRLHKCRVGLGGLSRFFLRIRGRGGTAAEFFLELYRNIFADALTRLNKVCQAQADNDGEAGDEQRVRKGFQPDPTELAYVADSRYADHKR